MQQTKKCLGVALLALMIVAGGGHCAASKSWSVFPQNGTTLTALHDGADFLTLRFGGWGPGWSWLSWRGDLSSKDGQSLMSASANVNTGARLDLAAQVCRTDPTQVAVTIQLKTSQDTALTSVIAGLTAGQGAFKGGKVRSVSADGRILTRAFPLQRKGLGEKVRQLMLIDAAGRRTRITLDPPCDIPTDGDARITLAAEQFKRSAPVDLTMTIDFPEAIDFFSSADAMPFPAGADQWFPFSPEEDYGKPSAIDMSDWLDKPAGKHGRIRRHGDDLMLQGKPVKLWGLNLCFSACAPDKALADRRAACYAKYGINAVRLHKYADGAGWAGIQSPDSFTRFDPAGLDRLDYQVWAFKQKGIYVKFSAHFGAQKLGPGDKAIVPYLEEFGPLKGNKIQRVTTPHSAMHYAPELQHVQILQMVNLLKHKNPYTGLTYAEDPAVAFVEIINEQSILFYTSMSPLKASKTIRTSVARRFCDWLRKRYKNHEGLVTAWGEKGLNSFADEGWVPTDEHLDRNNILPLGNPWYWDPDNLHGGQSFQKKRLLDTLSFLTELQDDFYDAYVKAMREAGYTGEIVSSNWQAGRAYSHYLNLHSDARVGAIDRHNYFGGGDGGKINNGSMLAVPGSGLLSVGMQQVDDRPFMLSEWIHVMPNEWGVEGPAIIGAYGMGLQGWDVSYLFQNSDSGGFLDVIGKSRWEVSSPQILGVFPAVARQVLRQDVRQSENKAVRYVHVPALKEGRLGFTDKVIQNHDVKSFTSAVVPAAALAVSRCVVDFSEGYQKTFQVNLSDYVKDGLLRSYTGQLAWRPGEKKLDGHFTMNTDATKAVVGFAAGRTCRLGDVTIRPASRYAAIYVTAREKDKTIATSKQILVVAMARARNTGMKVFQDVRIMARGAAPVLLEPVSAAINIRKNGQPTVHVLDHDGCRTGKTLPVEEGAFQIDGARDKTCYYLVAYP